MENHETDSRFRILVVDDSATQAIRLRRLLESAGYAVDIGRNGVEGLEWISRSRPAVVLSDIVMPEMDGYEMCRRIKANPATADIPVMLLTSLTDPKEAIRGLQAGADNFVTKPYKDEFLLSRLQQILANEPLRAIGRQAKSFDILFGGETFTVKCGGFQSIDLLLSTFENAVQKNRDLDETNRELQKTLIRIRETERGYRTLLQSLTDGIVVLDRTGVVQYVNPAGLAILGRTEPDMLGRPFGVPVIGEGSSEVEIGKPDGSSLIADMRVIEMPWQGAPAVLVSLRDVTDQVRLRESLRSQSFTDELTRVLNRRGFLTLGEQELLQARRKGLPAVMFFLDLDGMKWINDTLGHNFGDQALVESVTVLREAFRHTDVIGRVGGDEFAVIAVDPGDPLAIVTRVRERVAAANQKPDRAYLLSTSVGFTRAEAGQAMTVEQLLATADEKMYEEKRAKKYTRGSGVSPADPKNRA